ncbi:hypothetical protein VN97_g10674 [Penicillium thymicola]|uniref:Transcription factor domain-containing protein n=1 Tax=Penicillium thymicola TaxID=293382 RepID=A0AAI9T8U1_PENTH|nr:hypothetical protein VN97_g10674 [Penicillium thymicola]
MAQAKAYEPPEHSPSSLDSFTPAQSTPAPHNASPPRSRSQEDALILDNGVPHFISGKHWAWMAAELQGIQSVIAESQNSPPEQALEDVIWDADSPIANSSTFWPDTREDCYLLLNFFLANVDPIHQIVHRPSLGRRFDIFVRTHYLLENDHIPIITGTSSNMSFHPNNMDPFEPLAMSIFYAAVNSMAADWTGYSDGEGTMDVIQVELRRRLWAQICYLDFRAAEDHGFAPSIHGSDFDTRRPISLDDVDLVEGVAPSVGLSDVPKFTDMTIYLLRTTAVQYYGRIIQVTHASRKGLRTNPRGVGEAEALTELQGLFNTAETIASEFEKDLDDLVRYCDKRVSMQSMALDLRNHLKSKFWVMFWIQIPRQDREKVISPAMRRNIFVDAATAVENWCTIASSKACEPFQWHIFSHAGFYLILYVLSELRSPGFQSPEWADLRQRGLQLANAIYEVRGQHITGAWPAIIWLVNRIRFQQGLGSGISSNQPTGTGLSDNNSHMSKESFPAAPPSSAVIGLETTDFMGLVNLEEFDFAEFASLGPMGCHGLSQ